MATVVCEFVELRPGRWKCTRCGFERPGPANRRCGPPRLVQGANAAAAVARVAGAAIAGKPVAVAEAEQARRLELCRACPHWTGSSCALCGCYGAFKAHLATEHCPDPQGDRWA